ncbi:MAG: VWA domain-containing protein [Desulfobacterales bacterium]|nr:VWA domain-containing protein [Desulfobacterales bacterium]
MNTKKWKHTVVTLISLLYFVPSASLAATMADLVFVVDQSGSMYNEFNWIRDSLEEIDATIQSKGISANYGLAGFEYTTGSQTALYGKNAWMDLPADISDVVDEADWAAQNLYGGFERGYHAVDWATDNFSWTGGDHAKVMIMITDEAGNNRDSYTYGGLSRESALKQKMEDEDILLNVITHTAFFSVWDDVAFAKDDYIGLFDLDMLKRESQRFTDHFTSAKIDEIIGHDPAAPVPEPGTMLLLGFGLLFIGRVCRKTNFFQDGFSPKG